MVHPIVFFSVPGVPDYVMMSVFIILFFGFIARATLKRLTLVPGGAQNVFEVVLAGIDGMVTDAMGERGRPYFPFIATLGIFIFVSNLLGLIPGFMPPTANLNTTGACAILVFFMTHIIGFKVHGVGYIKHFLGPVWWLSPLMLPIEIIGHISRPISLTLRLFGNLTGHEVVVLIMMFLAPLIAPVILSLLGLLVAFIQAFVFTLLSIIYLSGALEEAH